MAGQHSQTTGNADANGTSQSNKNTDPNATVNCGSHCSSSSLSSLVSLEDMTDEEYMDWFYEEYRNTPTPAPKEKTSETHQTLDTGNGKISTAHLQPEVDKVQEQTNMQGDAYDAEILEPLRQQQQPSTTAPGGQQVPYLTNQQGLVRHNNGYPQTESSDATFTNQDEEVSNSRQHLIAHDKATPNREDRSAINNESSNKNITDRFGKSQNQVLQSSRAKKRELGISGVFHHQLQPTQVSQLDNQVTHPQNGGVQHRHQLQQDRNPQMLHLPQRNVNPYMQGGVHLQLGRGRTMQLAAQPNVIPHMQGGVQQNASSPPQNRVHHHAVSPSQRPLPRNIGVEINNQPYQITEAQLRNLQKQRQYQLHRAAASQLQNQAQSHTGSSSPIQLPRRVEVPQRTPHSSPETLRPTPQQAAELRFLHERLQAQLLRERDQNGTQPVPRRPTMASNPSVTLLGATAQNATTLQNANPRARHPILRAPTPQYPYYLDTQLALHQPVTTPVVTPPQAPVAPSLPVAASTERIPTMPTVPITTNALRKQARIATAAQLLLNLASTYIPLVSPQTPASITRHEALQLHPGISLQSRRFLRECNDADPSPTPAPAYASQMCLAIVAEVVDGFPPGSRLRRLFAELLQLVTNLSLADCLGSNQMMTLLDPLHVENRGTWAALGVLEPW